MASIRIDFTQRTGRIKPVHGVGQPPFSGIDYSMFSYLKEANIPFSRLHDVGGGFGGNLYVDIPNLFRDFDADPADPAAYDFAFTDRLIAALVENGVEPFFRLGVTIENYICVRSYRIDPPSDYQKWARICEGVIRHYTEGWADGFFYNIRYWEIWNEPDNYEEIDENQMWRGTKEQYYELYHVAASYLKTRFPHLKIGGYASCGFYAILNQGVSAANSSPRLDYFLTFFDGFLNYIRAHGSPLDFFSWHSYGELEDNLRYAAYARRRLDEAGYAHVETSCNEWNCRPELRGAPVHTALNTAMLIAFQRAPIDTAMFYDARLGLSIYGGLFHPMERKPYPLYYGFRHFGRLYSLGSEAATLCQDAHIHALAATDGRSGGILIVNTGEARPLKLEISGLTPRRCFREDIPCDIPEIIEENAVLFIECE